MSGASKSHVLTIYRRMLRLSRRLPKAEQLAARVQIRSAFRCNASESREDKVAELLQVAQKKLDYIRVITPRHLDDEDLEKSAGVSRYVLQNGTLVSADSVTSTITNPGGADASRSWVDPAILARHEAGMRRFRFQDRERG